MSHLFIADVQRLSQTAAMVIQVTEANLGTVKYRYINSAKLFALHLNSVYPSLRLKVLKNTGNTGARHRNLAEKLRPAGAVPSAAR